MPEIISINGEEIKLGENKTLNLNVAKLPTHTSIDLSVDIFRAKKDGPVLLLTGGLHGDETNGIEIIRRMISNKKLQPEVGTVVAIPIVNVYGFIFNQRGVPDGKDINRSFPGAKVGSLARMIAYTLMQSILPVVDCGIDFHTGGASRANYPQVRCSFNQPEAKKLASAFSAPVMMHSNLIKNSFRMAAHKKGKPIIVYEAGETLRFDEMAINEGIKGTMRVMNYLGMKPYQEEKPTTRIVKKSAWIRAKKSGLFNATAALGDVVSAKQELGYISEPFGGRKAKMLSSRDGIIIGLNNNPIVHKGDAIIHLAYN
ncbi:MAG: succinylglutamate desuccinylase/aspartoacylase family protein [Balneolaceae bacterium]|nr:succinylglutamate desuccinylase/aspartoacylase family protein [Balneolaceae bacterium]